jgi:hypothetical protein
MRNLYEWTMKRAFTSNAILDCMMTDTFRFHRELKEFLARPQRAYGIALPKKLGRERDINPVWYIDTTPGHLLDGPTQPKGWRVQPVIATPP